MGSAEHNPWLLIFVGKLLRNDALALGLLATGDDAPHVRAFEVSPPKFIRASLYEYRFAPLNDAQGRWWERTFVRAYLPPLSLEHEGLRRFLAQMN